MLLRFFFFFNDTATTEIYTLSLHDALPIFKSRLDVGGSQVARRRVADCGSRVGSERVGHMSGERAIGDKLDPRGDRKSTRLNSSHANISYAVFCLKKKKKATSLISSYAASK